MYIRVIPISKYQIVIAIFIEYNQQKLKEIRK